MRYAWLTVLALYMGVCTRAQSNDWQNVWQEAKLPHGIHYGFFDLKHTYDIFQLGKDRFLGKMVFSEHGKWHVYYYAYRIHDTADVSKMVDRRLNDSLNRGCRNKNIPEGTGGWAIHSKGYTAYLQINDVLYLLDDCGSSPCPYTPKSWAFVRSLLEFMYRTKE